VAGRAGHDPAWFALILRHAVNARYLRLRVPKGQAGGLWEWVID
jgi:hypothetical protein